MVIINHDCTHKVCHLSTVSTNSMNFTVLQKGVNHDLGS